MIYCMFTSNFIINIGSPLYPWGCKACLHIDLIFYLDTGELADQEQNRQDLHEVMADIKPDSITIHSSYLAKKSLVII